jgi:hypothetical protein
MLARESEWYSPIYGYPRNGRMASEPESGNTYFFVQDSIMDYRGASGRPKWVGTVIGTTYNGDHIGNTEGMGYGKYKLILNEYAPAGTDDDDRVVKLRNYENGFGGRAQYYEPGATIVYDPEINGGIGAILIPNYVAPQGNRRIGTRRFPVVPTPAEALAQARVVAPIPANRPYRDGERVEAEINGNWVNGTFRGHASRRFDDHGFMINVNGREQYFEPMRVRRPGGQPIIDSDSDSSDSDSSDSESESSEEEEAPAPPVAARRGQRETLRQRMQRAPPAQARVVRPPPPPPNGPGGVAHEIHNAFDNFKINKFMEIINTSIGSNNNFKNRESPLKPLIDNIKTNANLSASKKRELTQKITRIFDTIRQYGDYNRKLGNITACIQYVLMQPQEFIDTYIDIFITDCLKAYSTGRQESCIKGMYERIYYSFRDTVAAMCLDQMQGIGEAPLCKPVYIELFECFYETWPKEGPGGLNEMLQEWYGDGKAVSALSPENRIESFVDFVRNKINNEMRFKLAEISIRDYAGSDLNAMFGGRRRKRSNNKKTVKRRKNKTVKKKRGSKKRSVKKR